MSKPLPQEAELREGIKQILFAVLEHGYKNPEYNFEALQSDIMHYVDEIMDDVTEHSRKAEGRGRVAVLTAVKEWADDTEITYNKMLETELDKINALSTPSEQPNRGIKS